MDLESGAIAALTLGFLLGLKHATDADHVVAVSTIVGEYRNVWRGVWVGGSWGLGHTTPLLALGVVILAFRGMLDAYATVAPVFEFGVGIMLVVLGLQVFWNLNRRRLHLHEHSHDDGAHVHVHSTHDPAAAPEVEKPHAYFHPGKPFFRVKSYVVGVVHGLAGSAVVMLLLLLASLQSLKRGKWILAGVFGGLSCYKFLMMPTILVLIVILVKWRGVGKALKYCVGGLIAAIPSVLYYISDPSKLDRVLQTKAAIGAHSSHIERFHFFYGV